MAAPAPALISVFSSPQELGASLAQLVAQRAACCLAGARARFALGLSGGSLVSMLARELPAAAAPAGPAGLARWTLGFCDERLVPFEHSESTYGLYRVRATGAAGGQATGAADTSTTGAAGGQAPGPRPPAGLGRAGSRPAPCLSPGRAREGLPGALRSHLGNTALHFSVAPPTGLCTSSSCFIR
uniref:Glucosamine/galactosamine-6-phosphate isomerase domain-containing protein n=1 Tax=Prolemur simus TaxID=1328070 RepID=A0A8C8YJE9_PROSS